jgi:hypothetical protein
MRHQIYISALLLSLVCTPLHAQGNRQYTIDEVAAQVKRDTGSKILSAEVVQGGSGKYYRFKIEKKGRIKVLLMNPDGTRAKQ